MPDMSVVIPTFRRPALLVEAIDSVLAQAGVTTEIIVVDDCPDGSAAAVAAGYADRGVAYIRNPAAGSGRPASARNLGLASATAGIVHFLDDDDLVPEGYYRTAVDLFAANPRIGVVFGRIEPFGDGDIASETAYFDAVHTSALRLRRFGPRLGFAAALVFRATPIICASAMVRRDTALAIGGFDDGPVLAEDVEFYARAIRHAGAVVTERTSIRYRIGPSLMRSGRRADERQDLIGAAYRDLQARYRRERGFLDYAVLKVFAHFLGVFYAVR